MKIVRKVLSEGKEDINCRAKKLNMTPLMTATMVKHLYVVKLLVQRGADVLLVNKHGENTLLLSCQVGAVEITKFYLSLNVFDINCRGRWNSTPLMRAARYNQGEMVKFLVSKGADLSLVDGSGNNVLHTACRSGDLATIKYLLSLNVLNIDARNRSGRTAAKIAKFRKKQDLVDFLKFQGAQ
ncbi:histone-lysine N-methyltransferase EHMT2-like [Haliotis rufescens]|uniref:histone-lysine N-methyltransferase EHMT2-like n=1 Tax=Haliotis rufescens TaxID=6454 RepID=UPI00201EFCF2|nr:histone-lysine N-methyltransferase EHMT2-like [Haliotis rufescens]